MFLKLTIQRNPKLIEAAIHLHQAGEIPPNTYLIDIDTVFENTCRIVETAHKYGVKLYGMTKQQGRNPLLAIAMVAAGIQKAVAVDIDEVKILNAYRIRLGNVGHITQIPNNSIMDVLRMEPEVITVFSEEKIRRIGAAASNLKKVQPVLLRVRQEGDYFYPAQEGGFALDELAEVCGRIAGIKGIQIEGVTSFPCLIFDYRKGIVKPTQNLTTIMRAAEVVEKVMGAPVKQINGPGLTTAGTIEMIAQAGVTHGEPGSSMTGHTPLHAYADQPELPALVYVSEVSHRIGDRVFVIGGGFYPRGRVKSALVAKSLDQAFTQPPLSSMPRKPEVIDYYGGLKSTPKVQANIGDTVIYAFRSQVFVSRSYVAVVSGINNGGMKLLGLFDHLGNYLDPVSRLPINIEAANRKIQEISMNLFPTGLALQKKPR